MTASDPIRMPDCSMISRIVPSCRAVTFPSFSTSSFQTAIFSSLSCIAYSELAARIASLFRRKNAFERDPLTYGDLSLDCSENSLVCGDKKCSLSQTESELMRLLLQAGDKTTDRTVLLHKVWGIDTSVENSNLDNYIYFLRKRLKTLESRVVIVNRRGLGYRLEYNED